MSIAIVTDSTSDLPYPPPGDENIYVVPNIIVIDGQDYEDNKSITREEFYTRLPQMKSLPTTATASSGSYIKLYENLFQQGVSHIISIHPSNLLSGIFNAASTAAQAFGQAVHVIDSQQVTLGLGFQALEAFEALKRGLPLEKIIAHIDDVRRRVHVVAMLDTLEYLQRSGRVSWARARIGAFLNLKPMVEVRDGKVLSLGEVRSRIKGINRLLEMIHSLAPLERLAILHTNAEAEARQFLDNLNFKLATAPMIVNVTTIIGTHAGPNCLGFAIVQSNPSAK